MGEQPLCRALFVRDCPDLDTHVAETCGVTSSTGMSLGLGWRLGKGKKGLPRSHKCTSHLLVLGEETLFWAFLTAVQDTGSGGLDDQNWAWCGDMMATVKRRRGSGISGWHDNACRRRTHNGVARLGGIASIWAYWGRTTCFECRRDEGRASRSCKMDGISMGPATGRQRSLPHQGPKVTSVFFKVVAPDPHAPRSDRDHHVLRHCFESVCCPSLPLWAGWWERNLPGL